MTRESKPGEIVDSEADSRLTGPQQQILADAPAQFRGQYRQAFAGELSPRRAAKLQCLECCGWERKAARACEASACPLWAITSPLFKRQEGVPHE